MEDIAYFLEVIISRDKPLASVHYWRYRKTDSEIKLKIQETSFWIEHKIFKEKFLTFAKKNNLLVLNDQDLNKLVDYDGVLVSIYYKYFDDEWENPQSSPYENKAER